MHSYLRTYRALTQSPDISPVEHLEMLRLRDELEELKARHTLTADELTLLTQADEDLFRSTRLFVPSLEALQDFPHLRQDYRPDPKRWWWFLDVINFSPATPPPVLAGGASRPSA